MEKTKKMSTAGIAVAVVMAVTLVLVILAVIPSSRWHQNAVQTNAINSSCAERNAASVRASEVAGYYGNHPDEVGYLYEAVYNQ